jgi:hypothetical protein
MGEWSEYFEDFPEEDQANYVKGVFDPEAPAKRAAEYDRVAALRASNQRRADNDKKA